MIRRCTSFRDYVSGRRSGSHRLPPILLTQDAAWVRMRRLRAGSASVFGERANTRPGRGSFAPRWDGALASAQAMLLITAPGAPTFVYAVRLRSPIDERADATEERCAIGGFGAVPFVWTEGVAGSIVEVHAFWENMRSEEHLEATASFEQLLVSCVASDLARTQRARLINRRRWRRGRRRQRPTGSQATRALARRFSNSALARLRRGQSSLHEWRGAPRCGCPSSNPTQGAWLERRSWHISVATIRAPCGPPRCHPERIGHGLHHWRDGRDSGAGGKRARRWGSS